MDIVGVHRPNQQPREDKTQDLSWQDKVLGRVLKGVQIAQGAYGIYDDYQRLEVDKKTVEYESAKTRHEQETNLQDEFRKDDRTRAIIKGYDDSVAADQLLKDPNVSEASMRLAVIKAFRASGESGAIGEEALSKLIPDQSLRAQVGRMFNNLRNSKPLEGDRRAMRRLVEVLRKHQAERMKVHAYSFADTRGRRIGGANHVVNDILKPRTLLTGEAIRGDLTNEPTGLAEGLQGVEGRDLKGETRSRYLSDVPNADSIAVEEAMKRWDNGTTDPRIKEHMIQETMRESKGALTPGQAVIVLEEEFKALDFRKKQKEFLNKSVYPEVPPNMQDNNVGGRANPGR